MGKWDFSYKKNDFIDRWTVSKLEEKRFITEPEAFDTALNEGAGYVQIIYPVRKRYLENIPDKNYEDIEMKDINKVYFPFEKARIDYSGFWKECYELNFFAQMFIITGKNEKKNFEIKTCGRVKIWVNGEEQADFSPYERNLGKSTEISLEFKEGINEITVWCNDLAERDANVYFQMKYKDEGELNTFISVTGDISKAAAAEKMLKSCYLDKNSYRDREIKVLFTASHNENLEIDTVFYVNNTHLDTKIPAGKATLKSGETKLVLSIPKELNIGYISVILQIRLSKDIIIERILGTEIYIMENFPKNTENIKERKKEALKFMSEYGDGNLQKVIAIIENNGEYSRIKEILDLETDAINRRFDCSDFRMPALIWIYKKYRNHFKEDDLKIIKESILNYRYWLDEPGNDVMWWFSENHALSFHVSELLAGEQFKQDIFPNSGLTGFQHIEKAKKLLNEWFSNFFLYGYGEWNSAVYIPIDLIGCFALYELTEDEEIKEKAGRVLDHSFEIMAFNSFKGVMTSSHGRIYEKELKGRRTTESTALNWIAWGEGYLNQSIMSTVFFCISSYEPPEKLLEYEKWEQNRRLIISNVQGKEKVNLYMCKTKDYSISSALDYRKGKNGHQEHIFQLNITKDHDIQFWINHPGEKELNGAGRPSYWAGNGTVPMVEQYENNVFLMFRISEDQMVDFTHAYCPFEDFDEYIFHGNMIFLRKDTVYTGIYIKNPYKITDSGPLKNNEIVSEGLANIWFVKVMTKEEAGSFQEFTDRFCNMKITAGELYMEIIDFEHGKMSMDWENGFRVEKEEKVFLRV